MRLHTEWPTLDFSVKTLAESLGFRWCDPHPSGAASVRWYHDYLERSNVSAKELQAVQAVAADLLRLASKELDALIGSGALQEICHDRKDPAEEPNPGRGSRDRA